MSNINPPVLRRNLKLVAGLGMRGHEVSAIANATSGLTALANVDAPVPLEILDEWSAQINKIKLQRRRPGI